MKRGLFIFISLVSQSIHLLHADQERVVNFNDLVQDNQLWALTPTAFMKEYSGLGFRWNAQTQQNIARASGVEGALFAQSVVEAQAQFKRGTLGRLVFYLYNRGDLGAISKSEFQQQVAKTSRSITQALQKKGAPLKSQNRSAKAVINKTVWTKGQNQVNLEYSFSRTPFRAEFIRVRYMPYDPSMRAQLLPGARSVKKKYQVISPQRLQKKVLRTQDGDVHLKEIPMVNQGDKGYCVVATAERVLRYFERDLDQHEMAQLANTSSQRGTTSEDMMKALRTIARKTDLRVKTLYEISDKEFQKLVKKYNNYAKRAGYALLPAGAEYNWLYTYNVVDKEAFRAVREGQKVDMKKFFAQVKKNINQGLPLSWTVMVGLVNEPQLESIPGVYGHMRMIVGYNERKREILFSDSWGPGHEVKRLPLVDAWTISSGLYGMMPSNIR